ncbi:MAG: cytochrome c biogenesis protein CcdA [Acidobacteria bacterium]|nr:cytochrome c biogenesis protein CcdA [Acidobacteriota bacterium]MCK6683260.1 cytochrome c biogenesis CcdA family protein [Thermoanaerobaculia bacterium]
MSNLAELLGANLSAGSLVALPLTFLGGVVTGLNPCCVALYPAAAATCCVTGRDRVRLAAGTAFAFVAGLALATTLLGVFAALAGSTMRGLGGWARSLIGFVPLAMGVHLMGWLRFPIPSFARSGTGSGLGGAFVAGLLLSLVLAPCGTPVLAGVLSYAAYEGKVAYGALLLFLFGLGAGVPVLLIATVAGGVATRLDRGGWRPWVDRVTGGVLLGVGFYLLWTA